MSAATMSIYGREMTGKERNENIVQLEVMERHECIGHWQEANAVLGRFESFRERKLRVEVAPPLIILSSVTH